MRIIFAAVCRYRMSLELMLGCEDGIPLRVRRAIIQGVRCALVLFILIPAVCEAQVSGSEPGSGGDAQDRQGDGVGPGKDARVGPISDGRFLLSNGWMIKPAGFQVPVDTLPLSSAVTANGKYLLILNCGYNIPSLSVVDIQQRHEVRRISLPDAWLGLAISRTQDRVYVGGGGKGVVYELSMNAETGDLKLAREFSIAPHIDSPADTSGLAASVPGKTMPTTTRTFVGDVKLSRDGHYLYAADMEGDSISVLDPLSGKVLHIWKCGTRPYRILFNSDGKSLLVSSWAGAAVYQYDAQTGKEMNVLQVGPHPTDMLLAPIPAADEKKDDDDDGPQTHRDRQKYVEKLFVAAANTNRVFTYGLTKAGQWTALESINVSLTPAEPVGMTPSALALDTRSKRLYIVCSDANAIAVADVSHMTTQVLGFIPTGWYPTQVGVFPDGSLAFLNGKGAGSHPNPHGPNPLDRMPDSEHLMRSMSQPDSPIQYMPHIQNGSVSFLPKPDVDDLKKFTETVRANSPYRDKLLDRRNDDSQTTSFSEAPDHPSPIKHVIYVIKENRTYDQVLGDMPGGNGDKTLTLFGENITPNLHQLARDYILYDNFYENADVSLDGHHWAMTAISPDSITKMWPNSYSGRSPIAVSVTKDAPAGGYIWNDAAKSGVTVRNYGGLWVQNAPRPATSDGPQIKSISEKGLNAITDLNYRSFDLDYADSDRAHEFLKEWNHFAEQGDAPALSILTMGNDHTYGTAPGKRAPLSCVADNDYGIGVLVDGVSHSPLWSSTAIFIIEDDSQDGPDHVDSHRAPAWVISPYTRRGIVDSTMYNQTSILRTIEHILGMPPLTHFDASAPLMFGTFSAKPDATAYSVIAPKISLTDLNPMTDAAAKESAGLDFSKPDQVDDRLLNNMLWHALRNTDPPMPVRSSFGK
jgi:DNA-binding beta-propeller fold protein YncE